MAKPQPTGARTSLLIKLAVGLAAATAFGFLFMRSLHDTTRAAYTAQRQHLQRWTLVLQPSSRPTDPLLALRPTPELANGLFHQVFSRTMESLDAPGRAGRSRGAARRVRPGGPRSIHTGSTPCGRPGSGLETAGITPRCLVHRRVSEPGGTRQVFFVLFDAPSVSQFRQQLGLDPAALAPVLFIAGSGADFNSWLPQRVNAEADCLAPVETADRSQ